MNEVCNDYGDNQACLGDADPSQRMDYTDIGEGYIHWCSHCGPIAHAMEDAIFGRVAEDPDFKANFEAAIKKAEDIQKQESH